MMPLPPQVPRRGGGVSRRVAAALLRLLGWRIAGSVPDVAKCVVVAVPHTSNFDGLYVLPAMLALDLKMSIFGKKSLFAVPGLAAFLRWAGVMPLDRARAGGVVDEAVAAFRREVRFLPLFTPTADMAADHATLDTLFHGIEPKHKHRLSWPLREAQMAETD